MYIVWLEVIWDFEKGKQIKYVTTIEHRNQTGENYKYAQHYTVKMSRTYRNILIYKNSNAFFTV